MFNTGQDAPGGRAQGSGFVDLGGELCPLPLLPFPVHTRLHLSTLAFPGARAVMGVCGCTPVVTVWHLEVQLCPSVLEAQVLDQRESSMGKAIAGGSLNY